MHVENSIFLKISGASWSKQCYCFFNGAHLYSIFKIYSVLILVVFFWFVTINPNCKCKSHFFWKLQMLRGESSVTESFVEHRVYSIFKRYSILILVFCILIFQSASVKVNLSWNFKCSAKEAVLLLRSWSTLYIAFLKGRLFWF